MKAYKYTIGACLLGILLSSCSRERFSAPDIRCSEMEFNAEYTGDAVKTVLSGTAVKWTSDDAISVFDNTGENRIFNEVSVSEDGLRASFKGIASLSDSYTAICPAQGEATISSGKVKAVIPADQQAVKDSFAPKAALAIAKTSTDSFEFKNVCALLAVTVHNDNLASIGITAAGGNSLAGEYNVDYNGGNPTVELVSRRDTVTLAGPFEKGATYYIAVAPGKYTGLSMIFVNSDGDAAVYTNAKMTLDLKRNDVVRVADFEIPAARWTSNVFVDVARVTSSTACICWTTNVLMKDRITSPWPCRETGYDWSRDLVRTYKVGVYTNAAGSSVVVEHTLDASEMSKLYDSSYAPRYTVTGLDPNKTYYCKVTNLTDGVTSSAFKFKTTVRSFTGTIISTGAVAGDAVFYDNFDKLVWNGDPTTFSAGYRLSNDDFKSITTVAAGKAVGKEPYALSVKPYNVKGDNLQANACGLLYTNQTRNVLGDLGYTGYAYTASANANTTSSVRNYAGCIRVGDPEKAEEKFSFCTNVLDALPSGASVKVTFKAAKFCVGSDCPADGTFTVAAVSGGTVSGYRLTGYSQQSSAEVTVTGDGPQWKEYSASLSNLSPECRIAFVPGTLDCIMLDDVKVEVTGFTDVVTGYVKSSTTSAGIAGVRVTDGYSFATTDADGKYVLPKNEGARFIYLTVPADCEVPYDSQGYPLFYKAYADNLTFTLAPLAGGKQTRWNLLVGTDFHYSTSMTASQMALLKAKVDAASYSNLYSVYLGDFGGNRPESEWDDMKAVYSYPSTGVHFFSVMGNHDWHHGLWTAVVPNDDISYTKRFGPTRWSLDRGDVHIVGMNNSIPIDGAISEHEGGFLREEYEWLQKDLAGVAKTKTVILCVHIPVHAGNVTSVHYYYHDETIELLSQFSLAMIFDGHSHRSIHYDHTAKNGKKIHETTFVSAPMDGDHSFKLCGDGSPGGVAVFSFNGTRISNLKFHTFYDEDHMMRVYDASDGLDGQYLKPYGWQQPKGWIVVNAFYIPYTDTNYKLELFQDGVKCCDMVRMGTSSGKPFNHKVVRYWDSCFDGDVESDGTCTNNHDWWLMNQTFEGGEGKYTRNGVWKGSNTQSVSTCSHLYAGQLNTVPEGDVADADIEVRLTDPYGNVYKCSKITRFQTSASEQVYIFKK